jgi:hypothetical protein
VTLSSGGTHFDPVVQRYAWPSELDLMARLAGLELKDRWGGWSYELFDSNSKSHVSTYRPTKNRRERPKPLRRITH